MSLISLNSINQYLVSGSLGGEDNPIGATVNLLALLKVEVTQTQVRDALSDNPNCPSLLSISESLKKWRVNAEAYKVTADKLPVLPVPFIAHLKTNSGTFVTVKKTGAESVTYLKSNGTEVRETVAAFLNQWSGTVLLAEAGSESGQDNYKMERRKELLLALRVPFLLLMLTIISVLAFTRPHSDNFDGVLYAGLWISSITGLIITVLLLQYEYSNSASYLNKLCSLTKKTSCSAVLNSRASGVPGLSWSEIGFFYFTGAFLYLMLGNQSVTELYPLIALNILAVPYILFSIYYQAFVVKQWCSLCLAVQFVLFSAFLLIVLTHHVGQSLFYGWNAVPYNHFLFAYLVPVPLWLIFKQYLNTAKGSKEVEHECKRFKNNPEVFNSLLDRQISLKVNPVGLGILLGRPDAPNTLIKVCNPYCGPCARSFPDLEELLSQNPQWKAQVIFAVGTDKNDYRVLPVTLFLEMNEHHRNSIDMVTALGDWYKAKNKNYEAYAEKYPVSVDFEHQKLMLIAMDNWCHEENIQFSPTYFVNGKRLPQSYSLGDLKNIF
jgi:uncharacterized membrane protein